MDETAELQLIYDDYRCACLSRKYYGSKLKIFRRWSIALDLLVALSTTLAATQLFKGQHQEILQWIAAASALASLMKTTFGFEKSIERYTKLSATYNELNDKYRRLCADIKVRRALDQNLRNKAAELAQRMDEASGQEDADLHKRKLFRLQKDVEREIPVSSFYWPACEQPLQTNVAAKGYEHISK